MVDVTATVNSVSTYFLWTILFILIGAIVFMIWNYMRYKYTVILRVLTSDRKYVYTDKARVKKVQGVKLWRLRATRMNIPIPPNDAIEISKKGKLFVECYLTQDDQIIFIKDTKNVINPLEPLNTDQRQMLVNEIADAQALRKNKWAEMLPIITSGLVLVICLICAIIFFKEVTKPAMEVANSNAEISRSNAAILNKIVELQHGNVTQVINEQTTGIPS